MYSEFFSSVFSLIWTEYSIQTRKNTDQKNFEYGHFLRSVYIVQISFKETLVTLIFLSIHSLSANPTKWSNTLKQFFGNIRGIVWLYLTILWGWHLKG